MPQGKIIPVKPAASAQTDLNALEASQVRLDAVPEIFVGNTYDRALESPHNESSSDSLGT